MSLPCPQICLNSCRMPFDWTFLPGRFYSASDPAFLWPPACQNVTEGYSSSVQPVVAWEQYGKWPVILQLPACASMPWHVLPAGPISHSFPPVLVLLLMMIMISPFIFGLQFKGRTTKLISLYSFLPLLIYISADILVYGSKSEIIE